MILLSQFFYIKKHYFAWNLLTLSYIDCVFLYFIIFHMKKTSILSLLGLAGFLAFSAPTFAQEVEEPADTEDSAIVAEVEEADAAVAEDLSDEVVADTEEAADEEAEDFFKNNPEAVAELNAIGDEFLNGLELTDEERAEIEASFESPEDRAAAVFGLWAIFAGAGLIYVIIALIWLILLVIALWKAFTKAGEAGWKAIIPFYNIYIMYKIAGYKNWFWYTLIIAIVGGLIAGFVPNYSSYISGATSIITWIMSIIVYFNFARKYGWGVFTSILFVLFTGICLLFLGFGGCKYQGKEA